MYFGMKFIVPGGASVQGDASSRQLRCQVMAPSDYNIVKTDVVTPQSYLFETFRLNGRF